MAKKILYYGTPKRLEGYEKEKLIETIKNEISKIPKLKKSITKIRYYRNWVYIYHESNIFEGKDELLYRIAVYDDDYKDCSLQYPHKSKVIIIKDGTLKECVKKIAEDWKL
ncbi:hypothetical protein MBCUT_08310 [Methanobrevibacter cuticularis]|uniref:Uncharacterized protein n=1 Tax=Methanobrevibacter cuticularis TaxID=47311 RepID=A0A166EAF4_9EURY|nr:hypothetical protein [Methanobrevibacter cuticularis]KZX16445.1 hypothetical protein MBCUT_08310 [Methanobrevibacter cuticularis]